ncbi:hypothetical protein QFC19_008153 [Naganishia cerealis]|uniref:Uncharacterized protein n=1 Tax=Naganishia cerealis TaxID=610337 RepID=A0ACC2V4B2_9TREE|nr:hypothetical protein QFC19_008153 [Naganishia cerealis]
MAPVSISDITSRLAGLSFQSDKIVEHAAAKTAQEWRDALAGKSQGDLVLTKTLLFKPKTAKTAVPTPVLVIAKEDTETSAAAIGKLLNLKELRVASEDLMKDVMPGVENKDDRDLISLSTPVALRFASGTTSVFLTGPEIKTYLESLQNKQANEVEGTLTNAQIRVVDFASIKKDEVAEKPVGAAVSKEAKEAAAAKKKEGKKEDAYEMAVAYTKEGDFPGWYSDVLIKGDMLDYYDVSGCYILKPWSYSVWQAIQTWFDGEIKKLGVDDCYFPMFVSSARLEREKDHIEGFAPEVAWVTRAGSKDLDEPIAIRPTSETVMYPYYAKWIRSHRDLPLKLNQWNSVVRWEFKNPQPFLRTREFLWQEGHTAFLTEEEAGREVRQILDLYRRVYEDLLAVPVIPGVKSEKEKFAGGYYTTTVEGYIPTTGRGIQGATSHCLGQNFSKMFDITVEDPRNPGQKAHVWQNSWGLSTRSIGVMVMIHGDDQGLVMPPRVAHVQVVVVPVGLTAKLSEEDRKNIYDTCEKVAADLNAVGIRTKADLREGYTPGWKFNDWELRGVPVRLEVGPRDIAAGEVKAIRRHDNNKSQLSMGDLAQAMPKFLDEIHDAMFAKAKKSFDEHLYKIDKWEQVVPALDSKNVLILPWCEAEECEDDIKDRSAKQSTEGQVVDEKAPSAGAKSLCIPFDQDRFGKLEPGTKCIGCGGEAKRWTMFGRSAYPFATDCLNMPAYFGPFSPLN